MQRSPDPFFPFNEPHGEAELAALRRSVQRGTPFGEEGWRDQTARELGLESTLRSRGRPREQGADTSAEDLDIEAS